MVKSNERQALPRFVGVLIGLALATAACGSSEEPHHTASASEKPRATATAASEVTEYVGTLDAVSPGPGNRPGDYFVGITVEDDGEVDAYICDGYGNAHWLEGTETDGRVALRSGPDKGLGRLATTVTLDGVLRSERIVGTLTTGERVWAFTVVAATGQAGIYTFRKEPGGVVTARSDGGVEIGARVGPRLFLRGRATYPDGTDAPFARSVGASSHMGRDRYLREARYDEYRVVILSSGIGRGSRTLTAAAAPSGGTQWTSDWFDLP